MEGAKGESNEQLNEVCASLSTRLTAGIERALHQLRVAEDKEMLADEAYSLLRHTLAGTTHVPTVSPLDANMRTLATRPVPGDGDIPLTNGATSPKNDDDDGFVALEQIKISQSLDNAREYVSVLVTGVVADEVFTNTEGKSLRLRLDIYVRAAACMCWEAIWITALKPGERVSIRARTPWRDVMSYTSSGRGNLQLQLRLLLEDGRVQRIGEVSMFTPATLLQQQALGKCETNTHHLWPQKQLTLIAEEAERQSCEDSIYNATVCGASTTTRRAGRMCRIDVEAPDDLSAAAYMSALKQSIPDDTRLRLHAKQRDRVEELQLWARTLRAETAAFRAAGAKCTRKLEKEDVQNLFRKQIALDETLGRCKESE